MWFESERERFQIFCQAARTHVAFYVALGIDEAYLRWPVGVHLNHVLRALFDLELDVVLSFQGGQAAAARAHSALAVWGIWRQGAF